MPENASRAALAHLFGRHQDGLAGAVRAVLGRRAPIQDVQEVLQEAFLAAWRSGTDLNGVRDPAGWLFVITLNQARDLRRRQGRRGSGLSLEDVDAVKLTSNDSPPTAALERAELVELCREAIAGLGDPEKDVFLLRTSAGLSFPDIADALGIPVGTAKTRMRTALARLRQALERHVPQWTGLESEAG